MSSHVDRFRELVARHLGLQFDDGKLPFVAEVLDRRAAASSLGVVGYLASLSNPSASELDALAEDLTVNETYFFRYPNQFAALADVVVPARMLAREPRRKLNVLSAACASGEEPYSLAIALRAAVGDPAWDISIRAVDVNPAVLRRAAAGRYTTWSLRETPPEIQREWFHAEGRELVLDDRARRLVQFEQRNLLTDDPDLWTPAAYDVIFCRNVLMYFSPAATEHVVARLERSLAPGGYLFLGHAETLRGVSQGFFLRHTHETFYYQRRGGAEMQTTSSRAASHPSSSPLPGSALAEIVDGAEHWVDAIQRAAERIRQLTPAHADPSVRAPRERRIAVEHALHLLREERFDDAIGSLDTLPNEEANDPEVLLLRAVVLTQTGRFAEAEAVCRRVLALDELDAGAHYVTALCREGAGDPAGAVEHDQIAVYLDPMFAMPRLHLGLLARRNGDRESARRELETALLLFQREDAARLLLFGGGFQRDTLIALCRAELASARGAR